jgi:matrixin
MSWRFAIAIAVSFCGACGGSSAPSSPSPPVTTTVPATPTNTWSVAGRVVDTMSQQPISEAQVTPSWDLGSTSTGSDGSYKLGAVANPNTNPYKITVSGTNLISHDVWIGWQRGERNDVTLDAIRNVAPFSMDFYRQMVRGTYDQPGAPWPVLRWETSPRFYLKTVDQNGRPIEPEVLQVVRDGLLRAVPAFSGGRLTGSLESGSESRPKADGWINVEIVRDPNERRTCGTALIGANPGQITLYNDVCSCGSVKIPGATAMHEVGHALGFFHVPDNRSVMYPFIPGNCPPGDLSVNEKVHAALAYSRPRGNTDPDNDPSSGKLLTTSGFPPILADR